MSAAFLVAIDNANFLRARWSIRIIITVVTRTANAADEIICTLTIVTYFENISIQTFVWDFHKAKLASHMTHAKYGKMIIKTLNEL